MRTEATDPLGAAVKQEDAQLWAAASEMLAALERIAVLTKQPASHPATFESLLALIGEIARSISAKFKGEAKVVVAKGQPSKTSRP